MHANLLDMHGRAECIIREINTHTDVDSNIRVVII